MFTMAEMLKRRAATLGADLCGIADASSFEGAPPGHKPRDSLPQCASVIVVACRFPTDRLNTLSGEYTAARNEMTHKLDQLAEKLAGELTGAGFQSLGLTSRGDVAWEEADQRFRARLSLKHAAELAGLGRIGRNTLLVNERFGNMIWLNAVLTEASFEPDAPVSYTPCQPNCRVCVSSCPVQALGEPAMRQRVCYNHAFSIVPGPDGPSETINCNTCRVRCPNAFGLTAR